MSERLAHLAAADEWVVDGNYFSAGSRKVVCRAPTPSCGSIIHAGDDPRIVRRTFMRAVSRTELWSGNRGRCGLRSAAIDRAVRVARPPDVPALRGTRH